MRMATKRPYLTTLRWLVGLLLNLAQTQEKLRADIMNTACTVACVRLDPDLWERPVQLCEATIGVKALVADMTIRAIEAFGFHVMQSR